MYKFGLMALVIWSAAFSEISENLEVKLVEIEKAYAKADQGFFNECALKKNYFGLIFIPPFSTIVSESCSEAVGLLHQYVERITLLCERDPQSPISRYFREEYLPLYSNYKPEEIFEVILFFGFGLGSIENPEDKQAVREVILERLVKLDLVKNIAETPSMGNELREIIEKENLAKMLYICQCSEDPYLNEMGQIMEGYQSIDEYLHRIDLKEKFYEIIEESPEEDPSFKEEMKEVIREYIRQRDEVTKGLV